MNKILWSALLLSVFVLSGCGGGSDPAVTVTVSSWSKTSVASMSSNQTVSITYVLSGAYPADTNPSLAVLNSATSAPLTVTTSVISDDRTQFTFAIYGVNGCRTLTDYTATLSGGSLTTHSFIFNSSDDEFDNVSTLGTAETSCLVKSDPMTGTLQITASELLWSVPASTSSGPSANKTFSHSGDFASSIYVADNAVAGSNTNPQFLMLSSLYSLVAHEFFGLYDGIYEDGSGWIAGGSYNIGETQYLAAVQPSSGGIFNANRNQYAPMYFCSVRHNNVINSYLSFDGVTYTKMEASNIELLTPPSTAELDKFVNYSSVVTDFATYLVAQNLMDSVYAPAVGYLRYRSSGITGTSAADCPAF